MDESLIRSGLTSPDLFKLHVFEKIDSTNSYLARLAKNNAPEWTVVVSEAQSQGREDWIAIGKVLPESDCGSLFCCALALRRTTATL